MKLLSTSISLFVLALLMLSCERGSPETLEEFLTYKTWRPFQFEAASATTKQRDNYLEFLVEMRISYLKDGTYSINFANGKAPDQSGTWTLESSDSTLFLDRGSATERVFKIEDIQSISYLYSTNDSIGEVRVYCVAE